MVSECYNTGYMEAVSYNCTPLTLILHSFLKQRVLIAGMSMNHLGSEISHCCKARMSKS